jgi:hypothetical protein
MSAQVADDAGAQPEHAYDVAERDGADDGGDGPIVIANEFNDVVVRRVRTRNGMRLEIFSPRRETRILLDAVVLDCLSYQQPEVFTELLERTPRPGA